MGRIIGIDLGTTNSAATYMAEDGPKLIPNALGESLTPSIVGMDDGNNLLVGRTAKEFQVLHPEALRHTLQAPHGQRLDGEAWQSDVHSRRVV